jgi:hypothetical protein
MKKRYSTLSADEGALKVAKRLLAEIASGNLDVETRTSQISRSSNFRCEDCGSSNFDISCTQSFETGHEWYLENCCEECAHNNAGYRKEIFKYQHTGKGRLITSKQIEWFDHAGFVKWWEKHSGFFGGKYKDIYTTKEFEESIYCSKCLDKSSESDWKKYEYNDELERYNVDHQIVCSDCNHRIEFGTGIDITDEGESITTFYPCESLDFNPFMLVPHKDYIRDWQQRGWFYEGQNDRFSLMLQCYKRLADQQKYLSDMEKSRGL